MSRLSKFAGELEITIDGEAYQVKPTKEDKWTLMKLGEKAREMTIDDFSKLDALLERIIRKSIPDATDDEISKFLLKHSEDMISELSIAFGWVKRERMEEVKAEAAKKKSDTVQTELE